MRARCPALRKSVTTWRPSLPVPPVTRTFMGIDHRERKTLGVPIS